MSLKSAMAKNQAASGIAKFAGDDFAAWKFSMEMVLKKKGLWIVVNQGLDAASEAFCIKKGLKSEDPERKVVGPLHASEMNDKALAEIVLALDEGYQGLVRGISNAKEAWKALCDNYQRSTTLNKLHLKQQLMELKMRDGDDMMLHINKLMKIAEQLKEAQAEEPPESLMLYLLKSLPKEWDNFVAPMMLIIDTLDLPKVKANLLLEATRRKQTADARETKEEAMLSKQGGDEAQISRTRKSFAKSNWRRRGQKPLECYVCGEGHRAAQCPKRFHKARQTANEADEADESCHLVNEANKAKPSLYMDSGATSHMVRSKKLLTNVKPLPRAIKIGVAESGRYVKAKEKGDIKLTGPGGAERKFQALHVPDFDKNLLSVSRLCKDTDGQVTFTASKCKAEDKTGEVIVQGKLDGNLYKVEAAVEEPEEKAELADTKALDDLMLWHARMGHLGWDALKRLEKADRGVDVGATERPNEICQSCAIGKAAAKPVNKTKPERYHAKENLERIHSDLCGPILPQSRKGNNQFALFIDEKTRYIVGYAMKAKSQAPEKLKQAIQEFQRLDRKHKVTKFRSDNAKELTSKTVDAILREAGIQPEHSAPYSPSQNGLPERYNRTVLEMMRCLLHQAQYSGTFWEDAFDVALHILNRRVNKHTGRIPYEDLTGEEADYSHMKAFGATAYVLVQPQGRKLEPRSKKCYFLGYEANSNGTYRFWDPEDRKVIISKNATFDENSVLRNSWTSKLPAEQLECKNPFQVLQPAEEPESEDESEDEPAEEEERRGRQERGERG
jgi:hypothetical protein